VVAAPKARAASVLAGVPGVARAAVHNGSIRVELAPGAPDGPEVTTALLRRLLDSAIVVERIAPVATSLEDLFLNMTTRLEDRS
jgi:hypothetical protein